MFLDRLIRARWFIPFAGEYDYKYATFNFKTDFNLILRGPYVSLLFERARKKTNSVKMLKKDLQGKMSLRRRSSVIKIQKKESSSEM